jgi:phage shock protein PspC (stress-responsive transcriptional regulator)
VQEFGGKNITWRGKMTEGADLKIRKLFRSQENRMIGGVCGGMAEYFNIDPNLMRILWVVLAFLGGSGFIVYIASLIIIPNNPDHTAPEKREIVIKDKTLFWGSLLIVVGIFLIFRQLGVFHTFRLWDLPWQSIWAIILIAVGAALLFNRSSAKEGAEKKDTANKKLFRSRTDRMIAGICGGLAAYFNLDVSVIRILWVIGTLFSAGIGILIYLIMLVIFTEEPLELDEHL